MIVLPEFLLGVHDADGVKLLDGFPGTVVIVEAIGADPTDHSGQNYAHLRPHCVTVRLNHACNGVDGTLPEPGRYSDFASRCASFVAASTAVDVVIIGNEPNHSNEWVKGAKITAEDYVRAYRECRAAIKAVRPDVLVLVAAVAPWNNQSGDWLVFLRTIARALGSEPDGYALHGYTHGVDPALIRTESYQHGWHWEFHTYREQIATIIHEQTNTKTPFYFLITEADQTDPWADVDAGWVVRAAEDVNAWNEFGNPPVRGLVIYRGNRDDRWSFADKPGVQRDIRRAVARGFRSPKFAQEVTQPVSPAPLPQPTPLASQTQVANPLSQRLVDWGATLTRAQVQPGQTHWEVIAADGPLIRGGNVNIYVDAVDEHGQRLVGVPIEFYWDNGRQHWVSPTEAKPDEPDQGTNMPMSAGGNAYGVRVADGNPSDDLFGMGMVPWQEHHSYRVKVQRKVAAPAPTPQPTPPTGVPMLTHPVQDPRWRDIRQGFGEQDEDYAEFGLEGHPGIDFGTPMDTPIVAVDAGEVIQSSTMTDLGRVVKLRHVWGESVYAHLDQINVIVGMVVQRGQVIAASGNTGNSTGPHLHFAIRIFPYQRGYPYDGFSDPLPYLAASVEPDPEPVPSPPGPSPVLPHIRAAAVEFDVDWRLLASLAWAESSFVPTQVSRADARGLFQFVSDTWDEWGERVGAIDPLDPKDASRAGAAYWRYLLKYFAGNERKALWAWNWGMGRVGAGKTPPLETQEFANKVLHGRDLLWEVGA